MQPAQAEAPPLGRAAPPGLLNPDEVERRTRAVMSANPLREQPMTEEQAREIIMRMLQMRGRLPSQFPVPQLSPPRPTPPMPFGVRG